MATVAINRYGWSQPLVVTCRYATYLEIIRKQHGTPVARAAVIKLLPLAMADIKGYLGPNLEGHWAAIYDRLDAEPHGALAQVLANPLMLWLTWTIYSPPGCAANELADRHRFGSTEAIEQHLLAEFVPALYPEDKDVARWPVWRRQATQSQAERWLGFLASDSPIHRKPRSPRRGQPLDTFENRDIQNVAWWRFTDAAGSVRILGVLIRGLLLFAILWQQVLRILRDNGNWRDGTYAGHLPFRQVFLHGPLGQVVWTTMYRLLQLVPARTRTPAFVTFNNALRDVLSLPSHHLPVVIILALPMAAIFTSLTSGAAMRPRRLNIRPTVPIRWLSGTLQTALAVAFLMWVILIYWNHADAVSIFFSSRATWVTVLVLSLVLSVYSWPMRLVSAIDVVGVTKPLQSVRADNLASIFVTTSKRGLLTVTLALLCGPQIALIYLVYAVASTVVVLAFGGLNGFASRAYADACFWLAISRRLPWRPMPFLIDAERRGVFQEVGAICRFRHIRVQLELRDWYKLNRFRIRDWRPRLLRLLDQFGADPTLARLQSKADSYRTLASQNLAGFGADLTSALSDLASTFRNRGRQTEELEVHGEIVAILHTMVKANPGMSPRLAAALERFAHCLAESGREHEALGVISEAAGIYGSLAAPERWAFQARLADWLNLFPFRVGRRTLTPGLKIEINRVTDIYRDLVLTEPEPDAPTHARALIELASALRRLGRDDEAAAAFDSAARAYRQLIRAAAGDNAEAHARDIRAYTQALMQVAGALEQLKLTSKAAGALADALEVYRELAGANPYSYNLELGALLTRLANLSSKLTRPEELNVIRAAVNVYREAAEDNGTHHSPGDQQADTEYVLAAASSDLFGPGNPLGLSLATLSDLSMRLWKLGECDAALDAGQTGRRLATAGSAWSPAPAKPMSWEPITDHDPPPRLPPLGTRTSVRLASDDHYQDTKAVTQWRMLADQFDTRAFRFLVRQSPFAG